jgi:glycosyltransferase involved in cell wall biosynthesis
MKKPSPMCSVCIPTRNRPEYLRVAMESVLAQSFSDLELIISDNSTNGENQAVAAAFHDDRIRYFRVDGDLALVDNWISAWSKATGKYCAILGDDDLLERDFLTRLVAPMEDDDAIDLSFSDHRVIDSNGADSPALAARYSKSYKRDRLRAGRLAGFARLAIDSQAIPIAASVIRTDRLRSCGGMNRGSGLIIDYYVISRLALLGGAAYYTPDKLMAVRVHDKSESSRHAESAWRDLQWACGDLQKRTNNSTLQRALRRKQAIAIAQEAISARHRGWSALPATAWRGLREVPTHLRAQVAGSAALYSLRLFANRLQLRLRGHQ